MGKTTHGPGTRVSGKYGAFLDEASGGDGGAEEIVAMDSWQRVDCVNAFSMGCVCVKAINNPVLDTAMGHVEPLSETPTSYAF